jgi:hypothetical protein
MTWNTPLGSRSLTGVEQQILRSAITELSREIVDMPDDACMEYGIPVFDRLTGCQKLVMLDYVKDHLLFETPNVNDSSAVIDGTVGALFSFIGGRIDIERDSEVDFKAGLTKKPERYYRKLLLKASRDYEWDFDPRKDPGRWALALQMLQDRILHDCDYEMDFGDLAPEASAMLKSTLGIAPEYFVSVPLPEPDGPKMLELIRRLWN